MAYSADTWLTPIVIDSTNNGLVVTEDPSGVPNAVTLTLDAGTYFLHDDSSWHATKPGLLYAIQKLLNDGTTAGVGSVSGTPTYVYSFELIDPASSTGLTNNGLRLKATAPASDFEITWTDAGTTLSGLYLGTTIASPISDQVSSTSGADEVIDFSYATKGRMCTRDLLGDGIAEDKRRFHYKDAWRSSTRPSDSVSVVWDEGFVRQFNYRDVQGVEVHEDRASESDWAQTTGRAAGDNSATWFDVWDALTDDLEVVVVHNSTSDFQVDSKKYEVGKLWREANWEQMFQQTRPGGDLYDVRVPLWVDTANANYDH